MPQVPPGEHEPAEAEWLLPPAAFEAKVDTLRRTWRLPHFGQTTSVAATEVAGADTRTSSSNVLWHSVHWNS
jgi:hypothetical protein